ITDDLNLPFGTIRIKAKGSDGGHNGLKNINQVLNTQEYARFRFGISDAFKKGQQVDYVLGEWTDEEKQKLPERLEKASDAIKAFVTIGLNQTMSDFNGKYTKLFNFIRINYLCPNFSKLKVFHNITTFESEKPTVLTIGTFDGVHIGHKKIIDRLISSALTEGLQSVVLTFFPHPRMVLQQNSEIKLLNTIEEKQQLLEQIGLDTLIIHPFDKSFSELSAEEFVKNILIEKLNIKKIIIGYDHRFGKNRSAGIEDLVIFGAKYGFEVEQIPAQEIEEVSVSSTKIRKALEEGNITLANSYLGYNYFFNASVVE